MGIRFRVDRIRVITFEGNKDDVRIQLNTGMHEKEAIKELFALPEGVYNVEISPEVEKG